MKTLTVIIISLMLTTACGSGSSSSAGRKGGVFAYMDDVGTEGNGPMDMLAVIGVSNVCGPISFIGVTHEHNKGRTPNVRLAMALAAGSGIPVLRGASGIGYKQGMNAVSQRIADIAKTQHLTLMLGGSYTDPAIAVFHHPDIAKNITIIGIESSNALEDSASFGFLASSEVKMDIFIGKSYLDLIKSPRVFEGGTIRNGTKWLNTHMRPVRNSRYALASHWLEDNKRNNGGQAGTATPVRIADVRTVLKGRCGIVGVEKSYDKIEAGLKTLR